MKLLHVDSSILGAHSISRQLTAEIVAKLRQVTPGLEITYRDLAAEPVPHLTGVLIAARQPGAQQPSADVDQDLLLGAKVLHEFLAADIVVVGAPMYNFGVPSQLKAWIDNLAVSGKTFRYIATGVVGLAGGKRMIIASSRGGFYAGSSPVASLDHQEAYLSGFFGFLGVTDIAFVRAEGVNVSPEQRQRGLDSALAEVAAIKAA